MKYILNNDEWDTAKLFCKDYKVDFEEFKKYIEEGDFSIECSLLGQIEYYDKY